MSQISHEPEKEGERGGKEMRGAKEWDKCLSSLMPSNAALTATRGSASLARHPSNFFQAPAYFYSPGDQIALSVSDAKPEWWYFGAADFKQWNIFHFFIIIIFLQPTISPSQPAILVFRVMSSLCLLLKLFKADTSTNTNNGPLNSLTFFLINCWASASSLVGFYIIKASWFVSLVTALTIMDYVTVITRTCNWNYNY